MPMAHLAPTASTSRLSTAACVHASLPGRRSSARDCFQPLPPSRAPRCLPRDVSVAASKGFGGFGSGAYPQLSKKQSCPCGSGSSYKECCRRYHDGALPPTPEALMRSRYTAYAKGIVPYVVETTHPENPLGGAEAASMLLEDVRATCEKISWDKLVIQGTEEGSHADEGWVTFQTYFKVKGQLGQRKQGFHTQTFVERSRFLRKDGRWLYVDGDQNWNKEGADGEEAAAAES